MGGAVILGNINTWYNIKRRCYDPTDRNFKDYGGRGITVCVEWKNDFKSFYDWAMANGYLDNLTIDRIDVNGNYCPDNCRWATIYEQANNKRNNHLLTYNGCTTTMAEWSRKAKIPYRTLINRINVLGWPVDKALTTPVRPLKKKE